MKKTWMRSGFLFIFLSLVFVYSSIGNFISLWIVHQFTLPPDGMIRGFLTTVTTFLLFFLTMWLVSLKKGARRNEYFTPIIGAIRQIAQGDYNVQLRNHFTHAKNHPFREFVDSINHMAVELNEMERMRQEFISNVSHEIQSPLASISGFAKVLKRRDLTLEARERYLDIIETESLRLAQLSDNLLKLTSIESDHHPFEAKKYRLDQQIRKIILACEPQWVAKSLVLDVSLQEVEIEADEELMSQVWINLLNNSIKFTPDGGELTVSLRQDAERVEVAITDTGIGINPEDQDYIFERFYKVDKSRNRTSGGSGLGLSIVKKIIDMHEGAISVKSGLGEGTTFTVLLRLARHQ